MGKTEYFVDAHPYFDTVFNGANKVQAVRIVSPRMVAVSYAKADDYVEDLPNTNPVIAAWVTAQARLKLYSHIERLGDRALYMDTGACLTNQD